MSRNHRARKPRKEYELSIIDWDPAELRGVAKADDGKTVFVERAIVGERVRAVARKVNKRYDEARCAQVLRPSPLRAEPACPHFGLCGGCSLQHIEPKAQVALKQRMIEEQFRRIAGFAPETVFPPIEGPTWGYRHRARMSCKAVYGKGAMLGFRERGTGYVANMTQCPILPPMVSDAILPLRALIDGMDARDAIPQVEWAMGDGMLAMSVRHLRPLSDSDLAKLRAFVDDLSTPETQAQLWLQPGDESTLRQDHPQGAKELSYRINRFGLDLAFSPVEFTQINRAMNQSMISRAMELLRPQPGDKALDLFCGLGNFSLPIAKMGAQVTGVEGSAALTARAGQNARRNGLAERCSFKTANLFDPEQLPREEMAQCGKWLIDPPRDGAFELVKNIDPERGPKRIVYVSCKPATLARDAQVLSSLGYRCVGAGAMNMFPHTGHTEAIALFVSDKAS